MSTSPSMINKVQQIFDIKNDIKNSLISKGISIPDNIPFSEYSSYIKNIDGSGNSGEDLLELQKTLSKEIEGKNSLVNVLNYKFGLGLLYNEEWDNIIQSVEDIVVYKLFLNVNNKSKITLDGFKITSNIKLNKITIYKNKKDYKIKSKLELKDFNMGVK